MPLSIGPTIRNEVLRALPQSDLDHLRPHLQPVLLAQKQVLHDAGAVVEHIYFIEQGLASVLTTMSDGAAIEVRMVGKEGLVGLSYLLGAEISPQRMIVQIPGSGLRIGAA